MLLAAAYPFLVLLADEGYTAVYTVLFAWFATPRLTPSVRDDRGVWLVLTVAAWAGVLGGVGGAIAQHGRVGLNVAYVPSLTFCLLCACLTRREPGASRPSRWRWRAAVG